MSTMRQMLEAGVHFGHQTNRWNPKMKRFLFGERNGVYIIDLQQTVERMEQAYAFARDTVAAGDSVLFVGTKRQAAEILEEESKRANQFYINQRWLGGMLTNFQTIRRSIDKMKKMEATLADPTHQGHTKKELGQMQKEVVKLQKNLSGIRNMRALPGAVFILDTRIEHIAILEASRLEIPVIAIVDSNCDPDHIQYPIPGNDDAIRAGDLMARIICEAVEEGRQIRAHRTGAPVVMPRTAEEEAAKAQEQAEARRQAAAQAAQREARVAAAKEEAAAVADEPAEAAAVTDEPAETPAAEAPADAVAADETPAAE